MTLLRTLQLPNQPPVSLPAGFTILQVQDNAQAAAVRHALEMALRREAKLTPAQARLALIDAIDPAVGTHDSAAIRAAHWAELWQAFVTSPAENANEDRTRIRQQLRELAERRTILQEAAVEIEAGSFCADEAEQLQLTLDEARHHLGRITNEIQREMSGFAEVPDAAKQVARLGEVQARLKGLYLELAAQRRELLGKQEYAEVEARKLRQEGSRKMGLGAIFVFLGISALLATSVPGHLRPLGWVVILLGALLSYSAYAASKQKETPRERQVRRQLEELMTRLIEAEAQQQEADQQVRQFCARVGCTSPGQVLELQRRYDDRREEQRLHEEAIEIASHKLQRLGASTSTGGGKSTGGAATATLAVHTQATSELDTTIQALESELAQLEGRWRVPPTGTLTGAANRLTGEWGLAEGVQIADFGAHGLAFEPEISPGNQAKVALYLAARVALIEGIQDHPTKLPLVLDDPLRFWDHDALAAGLRPLIATAQAGHQVVFLTTRTPLLEGWRSAARAQGRVLTVIELGHPPA